MRWPGAALQALDTAVTAAQAGVPTVLAVEGEAGYGKSSFLRAAQSRLAGFRTLRALGEESARDERFQLLREWSAVADDAPSPTHILQAARLLGRVVDRHQLAGPVALVVDDLQWVDPESVDTVVGLTQRAAGDRLLVLAAHRPLGRRHATWRRLAEQEALARTVRLDGLDGAAAAELVASSDPDAPPGLAEQLRVHTGGSPLHMRALLREHSTAELASLAARGELPAPADLAATLAARIRGLAPDAARLLCALAVLGDAWIDLPTAIAVGGPGDADLAVTVLRDEGLVRLDHTAAVPRLRISHAVIRAAVYEAIPGPTRRRLHRVAAARAPDTSHRLRHRVAAAAGEDAGLADDLDRHADGLHGRRLYREAARYRRLAAGVTPSDAVRQRRLLDAGFEAILAHDLDGVAGAEPDETATPHQRLVSAMRLVATKQWVRAARVLDALTDADIAGLDPLNAHRARVLRGWTIVASGRPAADALPALEAAAASAVQDTALRGHLAFAYGQARQATTGPDDPLWGFDEAMGLDRAALATTPEGLVRLSWRGSAYALTGSTGRAIGDLSVVTSRIDDGTMDLGDGVFHALLGFAHWMSGEWRRASITIGLALATSTGPPHPVALAVSPLLGVVATDGLSDSVARSRDARLAGPLPAAIHAGDIADIAALAFAGTPHQRRTWLARRTADFGDPATRADSMVPYLWLLAMGIGASWAGEADATDGWADALAGRDHGPWRPGAVSWLRALARRARGQAAATQLIATASQGLPELAAFAALLRADAACAAAQESHPAAAEARAAAEAALTALQAEKYVPALLPAAEGAPGTARDDPRTPLSDREREVTALLLEGLSYAQIAEELFVTRSTVAFHLSNAYAKTGTSTRHELVRLLRARG